MLPVRAVVHVRRIGRVLALDDAGADRVDVPLTEQGRAEAKRAGELIKDLTFDVAYTSALTRAQETLEIILATTQSIAQGQAIEVEVWALDPAGFGSFVAEVPAPLAIGTVDLNEPPAEIPEKFWDAERQEIFKPPVSSRPKAPAV